jgi:signal transduction histidine kinase
MFSIEIFPYAASALVNALTSLILGFLVFFRNTKNKVNITFSLFAFSVAFWSIGYYFWQVATEEVTALFWTSFLMAGAIFIPIFYFHFVLALLDLTKKKKKILIIGYFIFIIFLFLNFTTFFVNRVEPLAGFSFWPLPGPAYHAFLLIWFLYVIYSTYLLYQRYKKSTGVLRSQIKYVFFGMLIGFAGGSTNYFLWYKIPIPPVANILVSVYVGAIAYSIIRYRLMDIRIVVRKIFIYVGLSLFVYVLYTLVIVIYTKLFGSVYESGAMMAGIIVAPFFVFSFYAFDKFFVKFANTYIFSGLYNYQTALNKLSQELNYLTDLDKIIGSIVDTIKQTMQLNRAGVLLVNPKEKPVHYEIARVIGFNEQNGISLVKDNFLTRHLQKTKKPLVREELKLLASDTNIPEIKKGFERLYDHMQHIEASLCLPLLSNNQLIGIIVLGSKDSGDAYTKEDLELLSTLSYQAGIAIDNARLYKEVKDFNKNLKQRVDEQTKEIRKKNAYLEELLKMKGEFLNIASHQLKTPISITRGYLSMILDGTIKDAKKKNDAIGKAMSGINRLNETVKAFLDASDLEGKDIELEFIKTDLVKLLQDVALSKEVLVKEKGLEFELSLPKGKLPAFNLDSSRLTEAISNLVDNAIFYTEKGKVALFLSINGNQAVIKIQDSGIGISSEEQKGLFTKFTRGKNAILAKPDGSGLGLYIAKKIVELHGGTIILESIVGKGTTFVISLPTNLKASI